MLKQNSQLTVKEQKTTAAYKLLSGEVGRLKKSLKKIQDELESYREKYHEADKNHAIALSKNKINALHEILKFVISLVCGGIGVNMITGGKILLGIVICFIGVILYAIVVWFDKKS